MTDAEKYRVWLAGDATWEPGPEFEHLALAIDRARRLAVTQWVAIELPTREWHVFDESTTTRLGPPQFARGSNLDLNDQAAHANDGAQPRRESRAATNNASYRIGSVRQTRPLTSQTSQTRTGAPAAVKATNTGLGPKNTQRPPAEKPARVTGTHAAQRPSAQRRAQRPSTMRQVNERRTTERFFGDEILGEPACYVDGQRAEVVDVSETGFQLVVPTQVRLLVGRNVVLAFADRHGRFDLTVRVVWVRAGNVGVRIEEGSTNLVGKMFVRKLIGQAKTKRAARTKRKR